MYIFSCYCYLEFKLFFVGVIGGVLLLLFEEDSVGFRVFVSIMGLNLGFFVFFFKVLLVYFKC